MFQIILDYKRKKDKLKINRYDIYSKIKIIENTEKYMEKIKDSYNELKNDTTIFEKNNKPKYHKYLQKIYKEMKERLIEYGYEVNNEEYNLSCNNNPNNHNPDNNNPNNNNNNNPQETAINSNINVDVRVYSSHINFQNNREQSARNMNTVNTNDRNEIKNEDFDTSKNIRKFKNAVRKLNKLKKLYKEINEETKEDINRLNMNKKCTCGFVILFIAFSIVLLTDFLLPIFFDPEDDFTKSSEENHEKFDSIGALIIGIILIYPFSVITSSYTLIMIYATNRKEYISGDYLYDKQINDNISLLKTVQIVCGYSFSILYCNIYFWRTIDTHGHYGKPKFYETTFIPDYTFKQGITIFMIAKIIVIVGSMIGSYCLSSCNISCKKCKECKKCKITNIFENDLGEFDRSGDISRYDNQTELKRIYQEKGLVVSYLISE